MTEAGPVARLRTVAFADGVIAQPTIEALLHGGWLAGLCTTLRPSSANLRHLAGLVNLPVCDVTRDSLGSGADRLVEWLHALRPDVLLSFAFPYRLPPQVLSVPRLGSFNVHGGKLPEYRGPQPIFWQIANGETEGAATVHRMDDAFDHGGVVASQSVPIGPDDTHGLHLVRLAFAGVRVVEVLFANLVTYGASVPTAAQDEGRAHFYRRPALDDLVIRWDEQSGAQIRALVKASNPWNQGAFASVRGINLRITDVTLDESGGDRSQPAGTILGADPARGVVVNCRDGSALRLDVVTMDEGIFAGRTLATLGIQSGERFAGPVKVEPTVATAD